MSLKETLAEVNKDALINPNKKHILHHIATRSPTLPAYIICDINNSESTAGARKVIQSIKDTDSKLMPIIVPATTPETLKNDLAIFGMDKSYWKYPRKGEKRIDLPTGLHLTGYGANDIEKVISCMVSHMKCWLFTFGSKFPAIVLEHDALFVNKFDLFIGQKLELENGANLFPSNYYGIVGLNNPKGATRKATVYYDKVVEQSEGSTLQLSGHKLVDAPWVDDNRDAPQGLAGNSAYYISDIMAQRLLKKIREIGMWPNDALMCKQLFPNQIRQIYPFVTELQGIKSTTQG